MSQDLLDEIEVINSIFEEDTLTPVIATNTSNTTATTSLIPPLSSSSLSTAPVTPPTTTLLLLKLPTGTRLRLCFPESYPGTKPWADGVHASAGAKGSGERDLLIFRSALSRVLKEEGSGGGVCIFDALEEFTHLGEEMTVLDGKDGDEEGGDGGNEEGDGRSRNNAGGGDNNITNTDTRILTEMSPPSWSITPATIEQKSVFVGRAAKVTSPQQAADYLSHLVLTNRKVRDATHNISAWRIRGNNSTNTTNSNNSGGGEDGAAAGGRGGGGGGGVTSNTTGSTQDYDDDGETAAGGRLLRLLQLMDVWDVVVVVSRWYGGVKLGPRRFALINSVGRDAVVLAEEEDGEKGEKGKGKGGGNNTGGDNTGGKGKGRGKGKGKGR